MGRTTGSPETGAENRTLGIAWRPTYSAIRSFVASALRRIRAEFRRDRSGSNAEITPPLDIEHIAGYLRVVERAQEDGRRNLPPPIEEAPAGTQREIIGHFANLRRRARQQAAEWVEKANQTLEQIRDSEDLTRLRDVPATFESKVLRYLANFESPLQFCVERERIQKQHYESFRKENKLDRVANYPDFPYLYYLVVPLLIAAVAYALTNLLVPGVGDGGLSVSWSVLFSGIAVVVPFALGMTSLRATNHISDLRRLGGWIGVLVAVAAILAIACFADSYVAAALADPNTSNRDVFEAILAAPLDVISSVESWTIFGVFVLIGLMAMILGYRSDDTYPGYGAVQRSYYRARKEREYLSSRLRKRINAFVDQAKAEVVSIVRGYKTNVRNYTRMVRRSTQFPSILNNYDVELEDACNIVLDRYRAANTVARDSEAPPSFAEHVCFGAEGSMPFAWQSDNSNDIEEVEGSVIELEKEATSALQKLRALHLQMINSVTELKILDTESVA